MTHPVIRRKKIANLMYGDACTDCTDTHLCVDHKHLREVQPT